MPTTIRRSETVTLTRRHRELRGAVGWHLSQGAWSPPTDVCETEKEYVVSVEVAGMRDTDFDVVFENGVLLISGQRPDVDVSERRAYHQMEIHYGKFSAAVALPGPVDLDHSEAKYTDGFLIVRMPKVKSTDVKIEG